MYKGGVKRANPTSASSTSARSNHRDGASDSSVGASSQESSTSQSKLARKGGVKHGNPTSAPSTSARPNHRDGASGSSVGASSQEESSTSQGTLARRGGLKKAGTGSKDKPK